ncbi:unnamed protein product [Anisakis simplex]|uniref:GH01354p (inferred by orthology to a D. melanogaster protein) n=1 Tax=Anisakis simplex TaxID=6269 RepID=A0A0M3JVG8_ANISI|nr:unnamed protein product [Anisakis simplex]
MLQKEEGGQFKKRRWKPSKEFHLSEFVASSEQSSVIRQTTSNVQPSSSSTKQAVVKKKNKKKLSAIKKGIIADKKERMNEDVVINNLEVDKEVCYRNSLSSYSSQLEISITNLVTKLKAFQHRAFINNPVKAKSRRRFVCGLREVQKQLILENVRCVIIADDLEYVSENDCLGTQVAHIQNLCKQNSIPTLQFRNKHKLGKVLKMTPFISVIAILDYTGAEVRIRLFLKEDFYLRISGDERWICDFSEHCSFCKPF